MMHGALQIHGLLRFRDSHGSHTSHQHAGPFQHIPTLAQHWAACVFEMHGYEAHKRGCCHVMPSPRGETIGGQPTPEH